MKKLLNKVAIVSGSSRGLGAVIARKLAQEGAKTIITYAHSKDQAHKVAEQILSDGVEASVLQLDTTSTKNIQKFFEQAQQRYGNPDIFIANAGVPSRQPFAEIKEEQYDKVFQINTKGTFFTLQQASRLLNDNGRIINISSGQTIHPAENFALYAASKAAPMLFVKVLAQEIGRRGITVNNLVAGPIDIGFLEEAGPSYKNHLAQANAFKRLAKAEDIADIVALLCYEESRFITGQDIVVDGGATHF